MPDPVIFLQAFCLAAVTAAGTLLLLGWPWRFPRPVRVQLGWVLGVGTGLFVGCWLLDVRPRWPPREDQHRVLLFLLPAVMAVECLGAVPKSPRALAWSPRLLVAVAAAPVVLYKTVFLAELTGDGPGEWRPLQAALMLAGLAVALFAVWSLLALLTEREPGPAVPLALALAGGSAAVAVMRSGYLTGGQAGLPLAGALVGAALASLVLRGVRGGSGAIGVGVVCLFWLVVAGRFFSELRALQAMLLFSAPLLCWLPELPRVRKLRPWIRGSLRVALVAILLIVAVAVTKPETPQDSDTTAGTPEPTRDDYLQFVPPP